MSLARVLREAERRHLISLYNAEGNPNHGEHGWFSAADGGAAGSMAKFKAVEDRTLRGDSLAQVSAGRLPTPGEAEALRNYTTEGFERINSSLRSGDFPVEYGSPNVQRQVGLIDGYLADQSLTQDTVVRRLVNNDAFDTPDLNSLTGKVISDKGYMSTCGPEGGFSRAGEVEMHIFAAKGTHAADVSSWSSFKSEHEVLFPRGQRLLVTRVVPGDLRTAVYAEAVR